MQGLLILGICIIIPTLLFIFMMQSRRTKAETDSSESEEPSESEDECLNITNETKPMLNVNTSLVTDAVNPEMRHQIKHSVELTISDVMYIERNLDDYEKISLIFLLSDNVEDCLNKMKISEWARREKSSLNWREKIWEALAIIQNFQIPKKYGFSKEELIREYFPLNYYTSKYIPKYKKVLFFICENLKEDDERTFLHELRKDYKTKHQFFPITPTKMEMEWYFSFLLKTKYISANNTRNCSKIAKILDFEYIYDLFKYIDEIDGPLTNVQELRKSFMVKKKLRKVSNISSDEINNEHDISLANSDSSQDNVSINRGAATEALSSEKMYKTDRDKICFIINQINFYTEVDAEYKHLLPPNIDKEKLHTRLGTEIDCNRLESVFKKRNFKVIIKENLSHLRMTEELAKMVEGIDKDTCSCFFVIILSHGNKGVVYCANSCYVEISKIISLMDDKKLFKIPKTLILQTCQGPTLQYESLTTDGEGSSSESCDPKSPDFLLFSSTVPGFASIRDKVKGTWFIQALCDEVENTADKEHFLDICTNIIHRVEKRKWPNRGNSHYQIPYVRHTLKKKLYI